MAHGSPYYSICCNQYISVARFSPPPKCPICGKESKRISKEQMKEKYKLPYFYVFDFNFTHWTKLLTK